MKNIFFLAVAIGALTFGACTRKGMVHIDTMRPADLNVPGEISNIVLVDRTMFDPKKKLNLLEGLLTGELPDEDKAAVQRALSSFNSIMQTTPRFTATIASERLIGNSLTSAFPDQLDWPTVQNLCTKYKAQGLLSIEIFDTDFIVTSGTRVTKKTVGEGENKREIEVDEWYARGVANLTMGIRFYDAVHKTIIDEQFYRHTNTWENAAASKAEAIAKLVMKGDASANLASAIGNDYAYRIAPMPMRIHRQFYRKNKKAPAIEVGARMADVNRWSDAIEAWQKGVGRADVKRAGFLMYNSAVAYEVLGDMENATKFAQDAYINYGNRLARGYVNELRNRQFDMQRLEYQQAK